MGYIESTMLPDERLVHRGQVHWAIYIAPIFWTCAAIYAMTLLAGVGGGSQDPAAENVKAAGAFGQFIAAIVLVAALLSWFRAFLFKWGTEYGITDRRVILKTGLIMRKAAEIAVGKIESLRIDQTITGRIFGYGTIIVAGTGGGVDKFPFCASVMSFRKQVFSATGEQRPIVAK